jgi:hypothetical protein
MTPSAQLRPSRSNKAMIGLPVFDPLTGLPGVGICVGMTVSYCYALGSVK